MSTETDVPSTYDDKKHGLVHRQRAAAVGQQAGVPWHLLG